MPEGAGQIIGPTHVLPGEVFNLKRIEKKTIDPTRKAAKCGFVTAINFVCH